MPSFEGRGTRK